MTTSIDLQQTIVDQLGGLGKLRAMVNAREFVGFDDGLMFRFSGCRKANKCRITLLASDLYKMELYKVKKFEAETVYGESGLYWEMLKPVFERQTGLYLSL